MRPSLLRRALSLSWAKHAFNNPLSCVGFTHCKTAVSPLEANFKLQVTNGEAQQDVSLYCQLVRSFTWLDHFLRCTPSLSIHKSIPLCALCQCLLDPSKGKLFHGLPFSSESSLDFKVFFFFLDMENFPLIIAFF